MAQMKKIGRNDPCPCGSGEKFKRCHMGKEDELVLNGMGEFSDEMSEWITSLPQVSYGRSREMVDVLDILELTGNSISIKFVDLKEYTELNLLGSMHPRASKGSEGGVFINIYKTIKTDPDNVYMAISPDIDDSNPANDYTEQNFPESLQKQKLPTQTFSLPLLKFLEQCPTLYTLLQRFLQF